MDKTDNARRLIVAAGDDDRALAERLDDIGFDAVVEIVVEELVARCEPPGNRHEVLLQLDLVHATKRASHALAVGPDRPVTAIAGAAETACILVEMELAELVRRLYGPLLERPAGTHRIELRFASAAVRESFTAPLREVWPSVGQAVDTVLEACTDHVPSLGTLATRYGSDKWGVLHWFAPHYEHHLRPLRGEPVKILEIGIGGYRDPAAGGESLRMWRRYFPRGVVYGMDVFPKQDLDGLRLRTVRGDQNDPELLAEVVRRHGPFDLIIDDGSHVNEHIITSFRTLFPHLRRNGWYVIEDLWTSYAPGFSGVDGPDGGGSDGASPATSLGLLKTLIDGMHYEERNGGLGLPQPGDLDTQVVGLHVYHNIAFIQRGVNAEGGVPVWIPHSLAELVDEEPPEEAKGEG